MEVINHVGHLVCDHLHRMAVAKRQMVCHPGFHACPADLGLFARDCCCAPEFMSTAHFHCGRTVPSVCGVECPRKELQATGGASLAQKTLALILLTDWKFHESSLTTKNKVEMFIYFLK